MFASNRTHLYRATIALSSMLCACAILLSGCGPGDDSRPSRPDSTQTQTSPLVIGERNVDQIRGTLRLAELSYNLDAYAPASRHYKASMLARGTGAIYVDARIPSDIEESCSGYGNISGSGLLSSDTRMVTAFHVVTSPDDENVEQPIEVSFDGASSDDKSCSEIFESRGDFVKDYAEDTSDDESENPSPYPDDYEWEGTWEGDPEDEDEKGEERYGIINGYEGVDGIDGTKSNVVEENPLLANRLYQLGLHVWAEDTKWTDKNENTPGYVDRGHEKRQKLRYD